MFLSDALSWHQYWYCFKSLIGENAPPSPCEKAPSLALLQELLHRSRTYKMTMLR